MIFRGYKMDNWIVYQVVELPFVLAVAYSLLFSVPYSKCERSQIDFFGKNYRLCRSNQFYYWKFYVSFSNFHEIYKNAIDLLSFYRLNIVIDRCLTQTNAWRSQSKRQIQLNLTVSQTMTTHQVLFEIRKYTYQWNTGVHTKRMSFVYNNVWHHWKWW